MTSRDVAERTANLDTALSDLAAAEAAAMAAFVAKRAAEVEQTVEQHTAAVIERAEQVDRAVAEFDALIEERAAGRPWADGLYRHQAEGMRFMAGAERAILGDGMGLGKTRTCIGWLDLIGAKRVLVIALAEVAPQFAGEIEDLAPHRQVTVLTGKGVKAREEALSRATVGDGVLVVNFELFHRKSDLIERLIAWGADTVIVDEAHMLKARGARKNVEAIVLAENRRGAPVRDYALDRFLATRSVRYLALTTGTPILNSPEDIFPLLHLVDPVLFPTLAGFNRAYTVENYAAGRREFKAGGLARLKNLLRGFYLARSLADTGIVLPPQTHRIVRVDITPEDYPDQARVIRQIANTAKIVLSDGRTHTIMHMIALVTRKRQANVWPAGIEIRDTNPESPSFDQIIFSVGDDVQESAKIDAVVTEVLRQYGEGKRQVVFSQFATALTELEKRLTEAGLNVVRFDGSTARGARAGIREDFRTKDGEFDVMLANYKTGGVGLNLQGAQVIHLLDSEWNPGKRDQALKRVHRIGQTEVTAVFEYRVPSSVDTWMANLVRTKERMIGQFNGVDERDERSIAEQLRVAMLAGEI